MDRKSINPQIASHIHSLLAGLRWRIKAYVWLEGLTVAVLWIGLTFWLALAIDYLPVLLTATEFPWQVRLLTLMVIAGVLAFILYHWILRRAFVHMADHSMAVLLERQYDRFKDSLVTSVEMAEHPDHAVDFNEEMLAHTNEDAMQQTNNLQLSRVFRFKPLLISLCGAWALVITIALFAILATDAFAIGASRIYLLDSRPWPRQAMIEVLGVEVQRKSPLPGQQPSTDLLEFEDGAVKVAKGSSVVLKVRAAETKEDGKERVVPKYCTVAYRTEDGERGRQNMKRIGSTKDGYQFYSFDGKPLKGILNSVDFDVIGYDYRVNDLRINVVDNPVVVKTELNCVFPKYIAQSDAATGNANAGSTSDDNVQTVQWHAGTQLPVGTTLTIKAEANKPLRRAIIHFPETGETKTVEITGSGKDRESFRFDEVPRLDENLSMEIILHDDDDVVAETPYRILITAVADQPPRVVASLSGIGTAVTPLVRIPFEGKITDDYGVSRSWIDVQSPVGTELVEHSVELAQGGKLDMALDFREIRNDEKNGFELTPGDGNQLVLTVLAADFCDLSGKPNVGVGDRYALDIVTEDELLAILEREEAGLREHVDQVYQEMTDARDDLGRVKTGGLGGGDGGAEPEDKLRAKAESEKKASPETANSDEDDALGLQALRALHARRALLQTRKSGSEVLGLAQSFLHIREQLENNRVDAPDRKSRLKDQVAAPLQHIGEEMFVELDQQIEDLEAKLKKLQKNLDDKLAAKAVEVSADAAIAHADQLLTELEKVLNRLIKYESYAELLDIVRELIDDQNEILDTTTKQRAKALLGGQ